MPKNREPFGATDRGRMDSEDEDGKPFRIQVFGRLRIWKGSEEVTLSEAEAQRKLLAFLSVRYNDAAEQRESGEVLGIDVKSTLHDFRKKLCQHVRSGVPKQNQLLPLGRRTISINSRVVQIDLVEFDQHLESQSEPIKNFLEAAKLFQEPLLSEGWPTEPVDTWIRDARSDVESRFWARYSKFEDATQYQEATLSELARNLRIRALIAPFVRVVVAELTNVEEVPLEAEVSFCRFLEALGRARRFPVINEAAVRQKSELHRTGSEMPSKIGSLLERLVASEKRAKDEAGEPFGGDIKAAGLIDRREEVQKLIERVADNRLTTVMGPTGMGKTCLARLAADRLRGEFEHGVCFVHLEDTVEEPRDKEEIAKKIGKCLDLSLEKSALRSLLNHLHRYDLLLILDACEVAPTSCASVASAILDSCPKVRVLITSREKLSVPIGTSWELPPLEFSRNKITNWAEFTQFPAVQLFLSITEQNPRSVRLPRNGNTITLIAKIIELVQGVPGGIVLEAGRWPETSLGEIVADLEKNRLGESQEKWLWNRIERSYTGLRPEDQVVFQHVAVFVGGFTGAAAEAVCSSDDTTTLDVNASLGRLVGSSLLTRNPASGRYAILNLFRTYALARLNESARGQEARRQHSLHYSEIAKALGRDVFGADISAVLDAAVPDEENISESLLWLWTNAPRDGLKTTLSIWPYWVVKGRIREGRKWLLQMRRRAGALSDVEQATWKIALGVLAYYESRYTKAISYCSTGAGIVFNANNPRLASMALAACGVARLFTNRADAALGDFDESKKIADKLGDPWLVALATGNLALAKGTLMSIDSSSAALPNRTTKTEILDLAADAVKQAKATKNEWVTSVNLVDQAVVVRALEMEFGSALADENLKKSLRLRYRMGDRYGMIQNLALLASLASGLNSLDQFCRAAILLGGLDTLRGNPDPIPVPFLNQEEYRSAVDATKRGLAAKFDKCYALGSSLTLSRLIVFACSDQTSVKTND